MSEVIKVKKLHPDAVLPKKAHSDDAGYDLVAINDGEWSKDGFYLEFDTGIAVQVAPGYHTEIFPRSSVSKTNLILANGIGLVDIGYTNSLKLRFRLIESAFTPLDEDILYKKGDRIGQLVIRQTIDLPLEEVTELSDTERGLGGFGSTNKPV